MEAERDALKAENERLREALQQADVALSDWLNIYASDMVSASRTQETQHRISQAGGGIAYYIGGVRIAIAAALAHATPAGEESEGEGNEDG